MRVKNMEQPTFVYGGVALVNIINGYNYERGRRLIRDFLVNHG